MAMTRKGKDQDKNRGSVAESIKEFGRRMDAARMSRMQGRSNLTSKDLEGKASGGSATMLEAPNGKEYMGPARGEYKAKKKEDQPKAKTKPRQRRGAGREDMMSRQRQDTIMRREEEKKKKAQGIGGGTVVG
jgi:hypothetical protein